MNLLSQVLDVAVSVAHRFSEPLASPRAFQVEAQRLGWSGPLLDPAAFQTLTALLGDVLAPAKLAEIQDRLLDPDPVRIASAFQELEPAFSKILTAFQTIDPPATLPKPLDLRRSGPTSDLP